MHDTFLQFHLAGLWIACLFNNLLIWEYYAWFSMYGRKCMVQMCIRFSTRNRTCLYFEVLYWTLCIKDVVIFSLALTPFSYQS